jgi:hypothetical protein
MVQLFPLFVFYILYSIFHDSMIPFHSIPLHYINIYHAIHYSRWIRKRRVTLPLRRIL